MGTGSVTGVSGTPGTEPGHQKAFTKNPVTIVQPKKWSALSGEFVFPTRNGGISQEERGHGQGRRARYRWNQMQSLK